MTSPPGAPSIFERHCWNILQWWNWNYAFVWFTEYNGPPDLRSSWQDSGIKHLNKEFYLIACLMLELVGSSFTSKIIWLESLPVIRNTSFVSCHSATQTWKKDQPSEWQWGKKLDIAQCDRQVWSLVRTMSGYVENKFVSGLKIDPMLRSYQVTNALVIINCCFICQGGYYYYYYSNT